MSSIHNIVKRLRESRMTESGDSRTLWMAKYKPVGHRIAKEVKKVVFYAEADIQDAEEELEAMG